MNHKLLLLLLATRRTKINTFLFEGIKEEIKANECIEFDFLLPNISLKSANK